ncbi:hypothetical protein D3C78_1342870 [compost metagenome]
MRFRVVISGCGSVFFGTNQGLYWLVDVDPVRVGYVFIKAGADVVIHREVLVASRDDFYLPAKLSKDFDCIGCSYCADSVVWGVVASYE